MLSLLATKPTMNEKNGNGRYRGLRRRKRQQKRSAEGYGSDFNYLASNSDLTMKFNTAQDPIYLAFDYMENKSVPELMGDLIQDSLFEITNFVSKVIGK